MSTCYNSQVIFSPRQPLRNMDSPLIHSSWFRNPSESWSSALNTASDSMTVPLTVCCSTTHPQQYHPPTAVPPTHSTTHPQQYHPPTVPPTHSSTTHPQYACSTFIHEVVVCHTKRVVEQLTEFDPVDLLSSNGTVLIE